MELTEAHRARLSTYEGRANSSLAAIALAYVAVYAAPILWPRLPSQVLSAVSVVSGVIWAVFVADLATRAVLSGRPFAYLLRHPVDLVLVAVPMLRPLRTLRVFTAANYLVTRGGSFAIGRTVASAVSATGFVMFVAALAMLDAERGAPQAAIRSFGTALWWSATTVTTVGYGDAVPVTAVGRSVAFALMLVGISLLGVVTASVAAWFIEHTRTEDELLAAEIREQRAEIAQLRELLVATASGQARVPANPS